MELLLGEVHLWFPENRSLLTEESVIGEKLVVGVKSGNSGKGVFPHGEDLPNHGSS